MDEVVRRRTKLLLAVFWRPSYTIGGDSWAGNFPEDLDMHAVFCNFLQRVVVLEPEKSQEVPVAGRYVK